MPARVGTVQLGIRCVKTGAHQANRCLSLANDRSAHRRLEIKRSRNLDIRAPAVYERAEYQLLAHATRRRAGYSRHGTAVASDRINLHHLIFN